MATYIGNIVYPEEFTKSFNDWLEEKSYRNYYISDQQKDALFNASVHDQESETYDNNTYLKIEEEIYLKKEGYLDWFKHFMMKNNFSTSLISDYSYNSLYRAYFTDNTEQEDEIAEMIKQSKEHLIEDCDGECDYNYSEEEFIENYGEPIIETIQKAGLIKNWLEQYNFTEKELHEIIDIANKRLAQIV